MSKPTAQQCHAMTTYFASQYADKVGKPAPVNRNKARWGFEAMLMDYTPGQARTLVDFYLEHWQLPNIEWFLYNYEKVDLALQEHNDREAMSAKRRAVTQQRLEEWRNRWKK
jgi:hypothetical protein